jgi:hypothetical protein
MHADQISAENKAVFVAGDCKMACPFCMSPAIAFDMQLQARHLNPNTYSSYLTCLSDRTVIEVQAQFELRLKQQVITRDSASETGRCARSVYTLMITPDCRRNRRVYRHDYDLASVPNPRMRYPRSRF